ncbi:hypothetical protein EC843_10627 [Buttiauxella sp. JUb87]|nr:hypothetical protein EC843_10627 [Buttiauxella sp. JUb87]
MAFLCSTLLIGGCNDFSAAKSEIRFVDMERVLKESGLADQKASHLKAVHENLLSGAEKARGSYSTLSEEKLQQATAADEQTLNMQWQIEQQTANQQVLMVVKEGAKNWMKDKGVTAIMPVQAALAVALEDDVTAELVAQLKDKKVAFNELPLITLKTTTSDADTPPEKAK